MSDSEGRGNEFFAYSKCGFTEVEIAEWYETTPEKVLEEIRKYIAWLQVQIEKNKKKSRGYG